MDITIDEGLKSEHTIHFIRSIYNRHGHDHDEYAVGGQGEDMLRGLPNLVKAVRAVLDDPSVDTLAQLERALAICNGDF